MPSRTAVLAALVSVCAAGCASSTGGAARSAAPTDRATGDVVGDLVGPAASTVPLPKLLVTPRGVVVPIVTEGTGGSYTVTTPCGATATTTGSPLGQVDVVLDPGHGGEETGAVGPNGLREKDLNLVVVDAAARALQQQGVSVVLTRRGDYRETLATRGLVAQAAHAKVLVSVHHNSGSTDRSDAPGTEIYYQNASGDAKRLGGNVYESLFGALSSIKGQSWVAGRPGVQPRVNPDGTDYLGLLRAAGSVPTVLVEASFISDPAEAALLARKDAQQLEGQAIARGILAYLRTDHPGSGYQPAAATPGESGNGGGSRGCEDPTL